MPKIKYTIWIFILLVLILLSKSIYKNITPSVPLGYYLGVPILSKISQNSLVIFCLNQDLYINDLKMLNINMNYQCDNKMPYFIKKIVAIEGDIITINDNGIYINQKYVPMSAPIKFIRHVKLHHVYLSNYKLKHNQFIVIGEIPSSYDSRYFGIVESTDLVKIAYKIIS